MGIIFKIKYCKVWEQIYIYIQGIRKQDPELERMVDFALKCDEWGIDYPDKIKEYFKGTDTLDYRTKEDMINEALSVDLKDCVSGDVEYGDGAYIDLKKVPSGVDKIRVYMRA